jgi:hypothetical protein
MAKEISRAERAKQELKLEKPKPKDRPKDQKSEFDQVLEKSRFTQRAALMPQRGSKALTEQAAREARRHDDRQRDDERREQKDRDQKGDRGSGSRKDSTGILSERVVGKGQSKQGQGEGNVQGRGGFSYGQ